MPKIKVAIQGIKASFHEEAAINFFGEENIEVLPCNTFSQTCRALKSEQVDKAILAIENSIAGTILTNYTLLRELQLHIVGEVYIPIHLHLLGLHSTKFSDAEVVQSHPMAIRQCQEFFENHPQIQLIEKADTAACAKEIADNKLPKTLAIANERAAEVYGLKILEKRLEKHKKNYTRFWVLSKNLEENKSNNKATVTFRVKHEVGSLAKTLSLLADKGINLSKIQSLPIIEEPDNYQFYLDLEYSSQKNFDSALLSLIKMTSQFSLLGVYKKNDTRNLLINN